MRATTVAWGFVIGLGLLPVSCGERECTCREVADCADLAVAPPSDVPATLDGPVAPDVPVTPSDDVPRDTSTLPDVPDVPVPPPDVPVRPPDVPAPPTDVPIASCFTSPIVCGEDDTPLVNGVPSEPPGLGGCPPGMGDVADFCMDRWEAMLVLVEPDGSLSPWSPYASPGDATVRALSVAGVVPQGYIHQVHAADACAAAGKRLCTDSEWLRACQGTAAHRYPYGDVHDAAACNGARTCHPAVQFFETSASWIWSELSHPCLNQLPDGLASTGAHAGCETAEGVFDLVGNLHEWTADPDGTFRGGFYVDTAINGAGCLYRTTAHNVWHWDYSTGFRCCADR